MTAKLTIAEKNRLAAGGGSTLLANPVTNS